MTTPAASPLATRRRSQATLLAGLFLGYLVFAAYFIWRTSVVVGGERYFVLFDDMMIGMRYARNLALHGEFTWNLGERVEGFTDPAWVLYYALLHYLPIPFSKLSALVQATGALLLALAAFLTYRLTCLLREGDSLAPLWACAATLFYYPLANWCLQGCEVSVLAVLLVWAAYAAVGALRQGRFSAAPYLILAVATLTRLDAVVPYAGVALFLFAVDKPHRMRHLQVGLATLAIVLGIQFAARYWYYGELLPNTYYLKVAGIPMTLKVRQGLWALAAFALPLAPLVALLAVNRLPSLARLPFLLLLLQCAYSVAVGGDAWEFFGGSNRYIAIAIPFLFSLVALAASAEWGGGRVVAHPAPALAVWLAGLLALNAVSVGYRVAVLIDDPPDIQLLHQHVRWAAALAQVTRPDARLAVVWAGAVPYFLERYSTDLLGKCDRTIARGHPQDTPGRLFYPGHSKWNYLYSLRKYRPDVIVELWFHPEQAEPDLSELYQPVRIGEGAFWFRTGSAAIDWLKLETVRGASASRP